MLLASPLSERLRIIKVLKDEKSRYSNVPLRPCFAKGD
jgi:hypothetical protein